MGRRDLFWRRSAQSGRDIPRAIFWQRVSIMGIYLLLNIVALYILPMKEIAEIRLCWAR